jgi:hypothetical protein
MQRRNPGSPNHDLRYFINSLKKRYWMKAEWEIDSAVEKALDLIAPSRDRTRLKREVHRILGAESPSADGEPEG